MQKHTDSKITEEAVLKAVASGAKSPTAVAKMLGYKSGSSSIIKAILKVVPDIKDRLAANQTTADEETAKSTPPSSAAYPIPDCVPFRKTSGYAMVWAILYAHREKGISKSQLTAKYVAWSGKAEPNAQYDVQVVQSSREDGTAHRSAAKASGSYWVERKNDVLKLHLVAVK